MEPTGRPSPLPINYLNPSPSFEEVPQRACSVYTKFNYKTVISRSYTATCRRCHVARRQVDTAVTWVVTCVVDISWLTPRHDSQTPTSSPSRRTPRARPTSTCSRPPRRCPCLDRGPDNSGTYSRRRPSVQGRAPRGTRPCVGLCPACEAVDKTWRTRRTRCRWWCRSADVVVARWSSTEATCFQPLARSSTANCAGCAADVRQSTPVPPRRLESRLSVVAHPRPFGCPDRFRFYRRCRFRPSTTSLPVESKGWDRIRWSVRKRRGLCSDAIGGREQRPTGERWPCWGGPGGHVTTRLEPRACAVRYSTTKHWVCRYPHRCQRRLPDWNWARSDSTVDCTTSSSLRRTTSLSHNKRTNTADIRSDETVKAQYPWWLVYTGPWQLRRRADIDLNFAYHFRRTTTISWLRQWAASGGSRGSDGTWSLHHYLSVQPLCRAAWNAGGLAMKKEKGCKLISITNRQSHMGFRLVPKAVTLNDLERHNGPYFALFHRVR